MLDHFRYSIRTLVRTPAYSIAAVLTLALGIGATTGVVSIVDAVLNRALPYREMESIAMVLEQSDKGNQRVPSYLAFKDLAAATGGPVAGLAFARGAQANLRIDRESDGGMERGVIAFVTPGFFSFMGSSAFRGRTFAAPDEGAGANRVAVLSYDFWRQRFAGDAAAVGRTITVDAVPTTIIGVMPRGFGYPTFASLWIPIAQIERSDAALERRGVHVDSRTLIRLRTPADSAQAAAALGVVAARLATVYPEDAAHWTRIAFAPISGELLGNIKPTLFMLAAAAALVLALGCVNVATLSLVRASVRARDMAVRAALGATRKRLMREQLTETTVVTMIGALGGIALAAGIVGAVRRMAAGTLPRSNELEMDGRVLFIALGVSLAAALLAGLVPSWRAAHLALAESLHGGQRGATTSRRDSRLRGLLVALQFAFAVMLLVGAGLLMQSFRRLQAEPDGYDADRLATVQINPPSPAYDEPAQAAALYERLRLAVKAVPGVQEAAVVNHPPGGGTVVSRVDLPGRPLDMSSQSQVLYRTASSEYLRVMGTRMVHGRWFTNEDMRAPEASGFVVNEAMARQFWPGANAVGQRVTLHRASQGRANVGQPIDGFVIGVVADMHSFGRAVLPTPEVFVPYTREVWPWITLVARAEHPPQVAAAIRKAIFSVDPAIPVGTSNALGGVVTPTPGLTFGTRELSLAMIVSFAVAALLLAALGLYGVIAYGVTQRTREVGIRMALGATPSQVARLVLGGAARVVIAGIALGLGGAYLGTRVIQALLFNTSPADPATYVAVPGVLGMVAALASWWPTRRALRVEPTVAMRNE